MNKLRMHSYLFLVISIFCGRHSSVAATEIDSFTHRHVPLKDATEQVDQITKKLFLQALSKSNGQGRCDEEALYSNVRKALGGPFWGKLENILAADSNIDKIVISRGESIYRNLTIIESFPLYMVKLGQVLQIGEHRIGTDKFGHFFEEGWVQFEKAYLEGKGIDEGIRYGEKTEGGFFGLQTTGIWSYGDLFANFKGMMFYRKLTDRFLEEGETPFVSCENNTWKFNYLPSWSEIIDAGMDEGINCNRYSSKRFEMKVKRRIVRLEEKYNQRTQCPVVPEKCVQLKEKYEREYPDFHQRIISPECLLN